MKIEHEIMYKSSMRSRDRIIGNTKFDNLVKINTSNERCAKYHKTFKHYLQTMSAWEAYMNKLQDNGVLNNKAIGNCS